MTDGVLCFMCCSHRCDYFLLSAPHDCCRNEIFFTSHSLISHSPLSLSVVNRLKKQSLSVFIIKIPQGQSIITMRCSHTYTQNNNTQWNSTTSLDTLLTSTHRRSPAPRTISSRRHEHLATILQEALDIISEMEQDHCLSTATGSESSSDSSRGVVGDLQ